LDHQRNKGEIKNSWTQIKMKIQLNQKLWDNSKGSTNRKLYECQVKKNRDTSNTLMITQGLGKIRTSQTQRQQTERYHKDKAEMNEMETKRKIQKSMKKKLIY
jgi:hypothetical protein